MLCYTVNYFNPIYRLLAECYLIGSCYSLRSYAAVGALMGQELGADSLESAVSEEEVTTILFNEPLLTDKMCINRNDNFV